MILYLPEIALEKIFSFLSYDEIANNRIVCKKFNQVCSKLLSRGFIRLEKRHSVIYKQLKSVLPRRESERRSHPLSRHCDILQALETRISMLNMTYMKYIESNMLCFIPGKVLDEMKNVLTLVENDQTPPRTHQLLQELRDLSSMAMEHFDEHILPKIKLKEQENHRSALAYARTELCPSKSSKILYAQHALSNELHKVKKQSKTHKHHISFLTQSTQKLCQKLRKQNIRLKSQSLKIREQEKKIQEQTTKIQEQEATLADIKKHMDEWDQKYNDLTTELVKARDDILSAAAYKSPSTSPVTSPPKFYKSNIKPRSTHILPKSYLNIHLDINRKRRMNLLPELPLKRNKPLDVSEKKEKDSNGSEIKADPVLPDSIGSIIGRSDIGSLISSSLENLLKNPLQSIKSRKRKMSEDIDLK